MNKHHHNTEISVATTTNISNLSQKKHAILLNLLCLLCYIILSVTLFLFNYQVMENKLKKNKKENKTKR